MVVMGENDAEAKPGHDALQVLPFCREIVQLCRASPQVSDYPHDMGSINQSYTEILAHNKLYDEAIRSVKLCIKYDRKHDNRSVLGRNLRLLAIYLRQVFRLTEALPAVEESVDVWEKLINRGQDGCLYDLADSLEELSRVLHELGCVDDSQDALAKARQIRMSAQSQNPPLEPFEAGIVEEINPEDIPLPPSPTIEPHEAYTVDVIPVVEALDAVPVTESVDGLPEAEAVKEDQPPPSYQEVVKTKTLDERELPQEISPATIPPHLHSPQLHAPAVAELDAKPKPNMPAMFPIHMATILLGTLISWNYYSSL